MVSGRILVALERRRLAELLAVLLYMFIERLLVAVRRVFRTLRALLFRRSTLVGVVFLV